MAVSPSWGNGVTVAVSSPPVNKLTRRFFDGSKHFLFNFRDKLSSWHCRNSSFAGLEDGAAEARL